MNDKHLLLIVHLFLSLNPAPNDNDELQAPNPSSSTTHQCMPTSHHPRLSGVGYALTPGTPPTSHNLLVCCSSPLAALSATNTANESRRLIGVLFSSPRQPSLCHRCCSVPSAASHPTNNDQQAIAACWLFILCPSSPR